MLRKYCAHWGWILSNSVHTVAGGWSPITRFSAATCRHWLPLAATLTYPAHPQWLYRSVIFFHTPKQEAAAQASKANLQASGRYKESIVTEIVPASEFYRAEEYHQQYLEKRGQAQCRF